MDAAREIYEDTGHGLRGPHPDAAFSPLRLRTEPGQVPIVVTCPEAVVGRHTGADVRLAFPEVSRRHCRLTFEQGEWRVYDLGSLNGVIVNDQRCTEATLYEGDFLRLGPIVLVVEGAATRARRAVLRQIADRLPPDIPFSAGS